ncbi:MAG: SUMF1/EgtB/PvdO family nonheme iron enzyme [Caldilineaceae bacterium]|nr:SUMF1/EgtB/PvdO family nonheme iron enzyme [Caldilineaceae bacterium]
MPRRFHTWFVPLLATLLIFVGNVASNWLAADLQAVLTPFRPWIWGAFGVALLATLYLAWREYQRAPPAPPPIGDTIHGNAIQGTVSEAENIIIGNQNVQVVVQQVVDRLATQWRQRTLTDDEFRTVATVYLEQLVNRYRYLDFRGMGVTDRMALQFPLLEMYVPLRARREMPAADAWAHEQRPSRNRTRDDEAGVDARTLRVAGRPVSEEEALAMGARLHEPAPVLDLLQQHPGVVVLGDPGAGKTTFLKYVALRLALGQGRDFALEGYLPILIPLSAYANALSERDIPLQAFLGDYYVGLGVNLPVGDLLTTALSQGRALLLMDGLDEVQSLLQRTTLVERIVQFFAFHRRAGNKFVLTSRIVGYREAPPRAEGLVEAALVDFDDDDIDQFIAKWTAAVERAALGDNAVAQQQAAQEGAELRAAVRRNEGVGRLASNPLLLTILALMKRQGVSLPERRAQLYDTYVKTLLRTWNLARSLDGRPQREVNDVETLRVLAPLALWMHESSPGVGLVKREAVRRQLEAIYRQRGDPAPEDAVERFLTDVHKYASLLLERGPGFYGFIHLTFQEYLAALAIVQQGQLDVQPMVAALAQRLGHESWREVTLLAVGCLGLVKQNEEAASAVVTRLLQQAAGEPGAAVVWAGAAVKDVWPDGVTPACRDEVVAALRAAMIDPALPPRTRLEAGLLAADLGDLPPDLDELVPMPAQADLGYDFAIGKYPVTNHQFRRFMDAGGYADDRWWPSPRARRDRDQSNWREPRFWDNERLNHATQPVVGVSQYEAAAYCAWLTSVWQAAGRIDRDHCVQLPSQAEWMWAARGGLPAPADQALDYPWRGPFDPARANTEESGLKQTTPVHLYPGGCTPAGVWDLSGNVWEWTNDLQEVDKDGNEWFYLKGGSYYFDAKQATASAAFRGSAGDSWYLEFGFRVVVVPISRG